MTAFRFPLQKVLELRKREERASARELAEARKGAFEAQRAREDLEAVRDAGRSGLVKAHGAGGAVGHLQNLAYLVGQVDRRIDDAEARCRLADEHVVESTRDFQSAVRQRQTLDRLRDRRRDEWRSDQVRDEQKTMDDVALTRHARRSRATASGGE